MKKAVSLLVAVCFFLPGSVGALMPPGDLEKRNLEAKLILVGQVKGTGKVLLPGKGDTSGALKGVFILDVMTVVKGYGIVEPGDAIHVLFRLPPEPKGGLTALRAGSAQVEVAATDLVVVYLEDSGHRGFYRPLAEGSSVVVIRPSVPEQGAGGKTTEEQ